VEILFELLLEIVFQFVGEVVLEFVFRGFAHLLANRVVRAVLGVAAGFGGGYWWGARLTELGRTEPPRSLWVSIGLAVILGMVALIKIVRRDRPRFPPDGRLARIGETFMPWRWSAPRLAGYALVNVAVAATRYRCRARRRTRTEPR
jgi:hypothetical protein